jgi:hypothetical protein
MSDRMRSSVRTDARKGDGAVDGAPEIAAPDGGATAVDPDGPAKSPAAATQGRSEQAAQPARPTGPPPPIDGTQVITPDSPPSGVFAGAAGSSAQSPTPAADAPVRSAPPSSPLVPPPGAPVAQPQGVGRSAGTHRQPPSASPAVPAADPPAVPAADPAAAPVRIDATQAVPLPAAGSRPAGSPGRSSAAGAARTAGAPAAATAPKERARGTGRGPRRARLQLRHIDTWSALKISLVVSIALFFVWMVAVGILYGVLSSLGVFTTLNDLIGQLSSSSGAQATSGNVISANIIFGGAAVIGAVNIVLLTALCTVSAFVYNLCSDLVGGLEVTLAERD